MKKVWLWRNFVDGRPEYWAFDNPFPIHMDNGDPQTLGEPCGYALLKPSRNGRPEVSEAEVLRSIARASDGSKSWGGPRLVATTRGHQGDDGRELRLRFDRELSLGDVGAIVRRLSEGSKPEPSVEDVLHARYEPGGDCYAGTEPICTCGSDCTPGPFHRPGCPSRDVHSERSD